MKKFQREALLMPLVSDRGDGQSLYTCEEAFKIARPWFRKTYDEAKALRDAAVVARKVVTAKPTGADTEQYCAICCGTTDLRLHNTAPDGTKSYLCKACR